MADTCPTVKIKANTPKGFRIINESSFDADKHKRFVETLAPPAPPAPLPPPPAPVDPLAGLGGNWKSKDPVELKRLAGVISGRAVENKSQAIAVIEAALAARG